MKRILVICGDTVGRNMGGVGVRNWELALALARRYHQVTLAIPNKTDLSSDRIQVVAYELEKGDLRSLAQDSDVIVIHGFILHFHPYLSELGIPLAVDLYVPHLLESLVWHDQDDWESWIPDYEEYLRVQLELLRAGDFFFCASERQRDYWLGWLHAQKRVNPHTYREDPTLRNLINVVPFGLPEIEPVATRRVLKGVYPGIAPDDQVILWSGGLWEWLDPLTLIRAVAELVPTRPELKLYFMGTHHPNPAVSNMTMPERAVDLARELGLYGTAIFFGDWAPYYDRVSYLTEADVAVVSHQDHIETHFSFRTRVMDCIWAGIPIIIAEGDAMASLVKEARLGLTVPAEDPSAMAEAIETILFAKERKSFEPHFRRTRDSLSWDRVVEPLAEFCLAPSIAADKGRYRTELERIIGDKDAFLEQVIREKVLFVEKVIRDRDAVFEDLLERVAALQKRLDEHDRTL